MKKVYAVVWPNGSAEIFEKPWGYVERLVKGAPKVRYRGFNDKQKASDWIEEIKKQPLPEKKSDISSGELRLRQINTPKWKKRAHHFYRELDFDFRRTMDSRAGD